MTRLLTLTCVIVAFATMGFAQAPKPASGHDDHNDGGTTQAGYAVITLTGTSGTTTGGTSGGCNIFNPSSCATAANVLVLADCVFGPSSCPTGGTTTTTVGTSKLAAFATYGLRSNGGAAAATQAGVLAPDLTTSVMLFVDFNNQISKTDGVAIVNPNSTAVNVTLTLRKTDGTTVATGTLNIPSHQQVSKLVTELFSPASAIPSSLTGTLVITSTSSTLPISAIGLRIRGLNFSTIPATNLTGAAFAVPTITTNVGGAGSILLPEFAADGGWATELIMVNMSSSVLTVRVDLFKQDGTALVTSLNGQKASSFADINIPAGGVVALAPRDASGNDDF